MSKISVIKGAYPHNRWTNPHAYAYYANWYSAIVLLTNLLRRSGALRNFCRSLHTYYLKQKPYKTNCECLENRTVDKYARINFILIFSRECCVPVVTDRINMELLRMDRVCTCKLGWSLQNKMRWSDNFIVQVIKSLSFKITAIQNSIPDHIKFKNLLS